MSEQLQKPHRQPDPDSTDSPCAECARVFSRVTWQRGVWICPACAFPNPMPARERLLLLADPGSTGDLIESGEVGDPLGFVDQKPYPERLAQARRQTGEDEAFLATSATLAGHPVMIGAFDFAFMGGTMSSAVGERIARAFEQAADEHRSVILCTASGGARMQEGTLSLFQMTKTVAALGRFRLARLPYIAVLCHPTLGGVAASFATRADVLLAEPRARIGFAGPRVIEQLVGRELPHGFQRAEFVRDHGFVDRVVPREQLRDTLVKLIGLLTDSPGR